MSRSLLLPILLFALLATSCLKEMRVLSAEAQAAGQAITGELHVPAKVGFSTFRGTKGSRLTVTVRLGAVPPGEAQDVKDRVSGIVRAHFKETIDVLNVSF
jgi:hypothetical protein